MRPKLGDRRSTFRCDLGQPDHRLDGLDLTEKRADVLELMIPPMLEQPGSLGGYLPLIRVEVAPVFDIASDLVDDRGRVIFLLFGRKAVPAVEHETGLVRSAAALLWL